MAVSRIHGSTEWRHWKLLSLAVLASSAMACKSTGTPESPKPARGAEQCLTQPLQPQATLTYVVTCDGFTPEEQSITAGAAVTFVSECDREVSMSFTNPDTLFESGVPIIRLRERGDQHCEIAQDKGGCHQMCFGDICPPPDDRTSKTGNLDVYPGGDPGPGHPNTCPTR
jgi:hypothetical protein